LPQRKTPPKGWRPSGIWENGSFFQTIIIPEPQQKRLSVAIASGKLREIPEAALIFLREFPEAG